MNFARFSAALVLLYSSLAVATPDEPSSTAFALRHYIRVLAPESMQPYAEAMVQAFMGRRQGQPPVIETRPARTAATLFCAGVGAAHPDVLVMPRRLSHAEYSRCTEQGVEQIAEVVFGYEVLALAVKREATPFPLTAEQLYRALAAEVPKDGQFQANTARTWHEVDGRLPEQEIRVVPETCSITRSWRRVAVVWRKSARSTRLRNARPNVSACAGTAPCWSRPPTPSRAISSRPLREP